MLSGTSEEAEFEFRIGNELSESLVHQCSLCLTDDGGQTWQRRFVMTVRGFRAIFYSIIAGFILLNPQQIVYTTLDGQSYFTSDGGTTWQRIWRQRGTTSDALYLARSPNGTVWGCGDFGVIVRFIPPVETSVEQYGTMDPLKRYQLVVDKQFHLPPNVHQIEVYSLGGRCVARFIADGCDVVELNGVAPGVYAVQLRSIDGRIEPMVILIPP